MGADKPVPVVNVPPVIFIDGPTSKVITGIVQGAWYPEILVAVINSVGVPVEDYLDDIGIYSRKLVIRMDCDGESNWVRSIVEVWQIQSAGGLDN